MRPPPVKLPDTLQDLISKYRTHYGGIKRAALLEGVTALSAMFTGQQPLKPGYLSKKHLRQAYVCYYLAVNYAKIRQVLQELATFAPLPTGASVLDFGCGPGTGALAAMDELKNPKLSLYDIVQEALDDATFLLEAYGSKHVRAASMIPDGRFDLVIASNVLAEIQDPKPLRQLIDNHLEPAGHLILIEPATEAPSRRLMEWRDELTADGYRIAAPCINAVKCPLRASPDLWCHQDKSWLVPGFVDAVDRLLGWNKESLKYSYLIVTRAGKTRGDKSPGSWRVVSNLHRAKGRMWTSICGEPGLVRAEMLKRHRSDDTEDFEHCRRGDALEIEPTPTGRFEAGVKIKRS